MTILLTYDLGGTSLRCGPPSTRERQLLIRQVCSTPNYTNVVAHGKPCCLTR